MQVTDLACGAFEALLLRRGWSQLSVRKLISCSGMLIGAAALCLFGAGEFKQRSQLVSTRVFSL